MTRGCSSLDLLRTGPTGLRRLTSSGRGRGPDERYAPPNGLRRAPGEPDDRRTAAEPGSGTTADARGRRRENIA
ncbi:hypothetical protein HMPREF0682_0862 [Propionibacterium acidifaciens F0233]|uniref:Uncharacterized protein n=1 Tax=Propionibacterium acidifaciens F0233 TaxID=553198 RepID=U2RMU9_9ACTN|nr:hypothetical protein HMPREF0682_0862 [Propionibacterium acidifaciens F0233]